MIEFQYRKAREIIDQVADDLSAFDDQGLIDYTKLYKIIRRCNADMGVKINPEKQELIHVKNFKSYLPDDFNSLNFSFVCKSHNVNVTPPKGFEVHYETVCQGKKHCKPCITECDNEVVIYQKLDANWSQFKTLEIPRVNNKSFGKCKSDCPNIHSRSLLEFEIGHDNSITTNFENGHMYINYVGNLEDCDEDLLVIDHPLIEPYYEGALTRQILKLVAYNKDGDVAQIYGDAKIEASRARKQALDFINMPGYQEIHDLYNAQRKRLYNKYFRPITG